MTTLVKSILVIFLLIFIGFRLYIRFRPPKNEGMDMINEIIKKSYVAPYNFSFNNVRDSLGIPRLEADWTIISADSTGGLWGYENKIQDDKPLHWKKEIRLKNNSLTNEIDYYQKINDSVKHSVVYNFDFIRNSWSCSYAKKNANNIFPVQGNKISLIKADSIITSWGLERRP